MAKQFKCLSKETLLDRNYEWNYNGKIIEMQVWKTEPWNHKDQLPLGTHTLVWKQVLLRAEMQTTEGQHSQADETIQEPLRLPCYLHLPMPPADVCHHQVLASVTDWYGNPMQCCAWDKGRRASLVWAFLQNLQYKSWCYSLNRVSFQI